MAKTEEEIAMEYTVDLSMIKSKLVSASVQREIQKAVLYGIAKGKEMEKAHILEKINSFIGNV